MRFKTLFSKKPSTKTEQLNKLSKDALELNNKTASIKQILAEQAYYE